MCQRMHNGYIGNVDLLNNMILKGITLNKPRKIKGYQGSNSQLYHSYRWRKDREAHLLANPLCVLCLELDNRTTPATVSDHIIPISKGGSIWDWSNRQPLCKSCNAKKTALDNPNNQ